MANQLTRRTDVYGQIIWSHFNGKQSFEIVERDDKVFFISGGASDYFAEFKDWPSHQRKGINAAKGRVLDIGAGAGRVSRYLQSKGLRATAIDKSPLAIRVCKKRGVKDARSLSIEQIGRFRAGTFDSVVMYGNNFGLFAGPRKAKTLLKLLHRITKTACRHYCGEHRSVQNHRPHRSYRRLNHARGRMAGQLKLRIRFRDLVGPWFDYLLASPKEMGGILRGTGWKVRTFVRSEARQYVAVIQRLD